MSRRGLAWNRAGTSPRRRDERAGRRRAESRADRREPRHAEAAARDPRGGAAAGDGAAHRGDRHRQGRRRARAPRPLPAGARPVRARRLRGALPHPDRERAVRPRAGRLHRSARSARGPLRAGGRGDGLPRRDRGARRAAAGEAPARAARSRIRAHRRRRDAADDGARDRRHQPGSAAGGARGALPRGSLLPLERRPAAAAAAARAPRRRGPAGARAAPAAGGIARRRALRARRRGARAPRRALLARQRAGADERAGAPADPRRGPPHRPRGPGGDLRFRALAAAGSGERVGRSGSPTATPACGRRPPPSGSPRCCGRTEATSPAPPASSACRARRSATACAGSASPPVPPAASVAVRALREESDGSARGRRRLVRGAAVLAHLPRGGPRLGRAPRRRRHRLPGRPGHARPAPAHPPRALRDGDLPDPLVRDLAFDARLGEHAVRSVWAQAHPRRAAAMSAAGPAANAVLVLVAAFAIRAGMAAGVFHAPASIGFEHLVEANSDGARGDGRRCCSRFCSR